MNPGDDLSGEWRGLYNYPAAQPPTEFTATLHDAGGALAGHTVEPGMRGGTVTARIDGRRTGTAVTFTKLYDDERNGDYDTVAYQGAVDADGTEIAGRWTIPGGWSGTFIMVRERGVEAEVEAEAAMTEPEHAPPVVRAAQGSAVRSVWRAGLARSIGHGTLAALIGKARRT